MGLMALIETIASHAHVPPAGSSLCDNAKFSAATTRSITFVRDFDMPQYSQTDHTSTSIQSSEIVFFSPRLQFDSRTTGNRFMKSHTRGCASGS